MSNKKDNKKQQEEIIDNEENEELNPEIYTLIDENDKESDYRLLGTPEQDGQVYKAFIPAGADIDEIDEYIILKYLVDDDGEGYLETIEDDEEFESVADIFDDELFDILYD